MVAAFEKDKETEIELYKVILFQGFYQVWKYNKPLNLRFLFEEELVNFEHRAQKEATEEVVVSASVPSSTSALPKAEFVREVPEESALELAKAAGADLMHSS